MSEGHHEGSFLNGVRVLEIADEWGEFCGKILAGLGADVIKVEPPGGEVTRSYGPFVRDEPHRDRSLHFWHYNFGKRSIELDLDDATDRDVVLDLVRSVDLVITTRPRPELERQGLEWDALREVNPALVFLHVTPFGDDGPWADYVGSDLVHLALGGVMMNCGYDPEPSGEYDTPPIAPQMWHASHVVGEVSAFQAVAALNYARETGTGQRLSCSVHDAVSKNTETDVPDWIYSRQTHYRQTCRHSMPQILGSAIARTKDGRWMLPYRTYLPGFVTSHAATLSVLEEFGVPFDLAEDKYEDVDFLRRPETGLHVGAVIENLVGKLQYDRDLWKRGQAAGLTWGPLRKPEENLDDEHWAARDTFTEVDYPEIGATIRQVGGKWYAPGLSWRTGPRAPLLDEHATQIRGEARASAGGTLRSTPELVENPRRTAAPSRHGRPFALSGVRVVDLSWMLASAGAGRFFTALGADVIKVEHSSRPDGMRMGTGYVSDGKRAAREAATEPIVGIPGPGELNRSGSFMEINSGKRSLSLNLKTEEGKTILRELLADADIVTEGYSPGTMERMGFGYDQLREIKPDIIYVQQSGMGQQGTYGRLRSFGPTAQAFSGLSEMSGLDEPFAPAGIGYSFLDWCGAYQMALAMMAALYRRRQTGEGCWIDSSQTEAGIYLTGTAILDHSVNGRQWQRYGNRSPYKPASPHAAFRARGDDRWIAISAFTEQHWLDLVDVLDVPELAADPRFATLELRIEHHVVLDRAIEGATSQRDPFELMTALQARRVPAGVCQTAQDRYEDDPQLAHLGWLVELDQSTIGTWPVKEVPVTFSETPPYVGGFLDRSGPSYGEDTDHVLTEILGKTKEEVTRLRESGVI